MKIVLTSFIFHMMHYKQQMDHYSPQTEVIYLNYYALIILNCDIFTRTTYYPHQIDHARYNKPTYLMHVENSLNLYFLIFISLADSHKGINAVQQCSIKNQKGTITIDSTAITPFWFSTDHL